MLFNKDYFSKEKFKYASAIIKNSFCFCSYSASQEEFFNESLSQENQDNYFICRLAQIFYSEGDETNAFELLFSRITSTEEGSHLIVERFMQFASKAFKKPALKIIFDIIKTKMVDSLYDKDFIENSIECLFQYSETIEDEISLDQIHKLIIDLSLKHLLYGEGSKKIWEKLFESSSNMTIIFTEYISDIQTFLFNNFTKRINYDLMECLKIREHESEEYSIFMYKKHFYNLITKEFQTVTNPDYVQAIEKILIEFK